MLRQLITPLLIVLLSVFSLRLQAQESLLPDEPILLAIAAGEPQRVTFSAQDEQVLSFYAEAVDDSLDPVLRIYDNNGTILAENDDYNYPDTRDALIEGFSAPYAGSFTLEVGSYAESSGEAEVLMLPGLGQALYRNSFDELSEWETVSLEAETPPTLEARNGLFALNQDGIAQTAIAIGFPVQTSRYYVQTMLESIAGSQGWQAGLVLEYEDAQNYIAILVNQRGAWQVQRAVDGAVTVPRDWNTHPAIMAGETAFTLGVLVHANGLEVFYNGAYIGSVAAQMRSEGQVGLTLTTAAALGSSVTARYEDLLVTVPRNEQETAVEAPRKIIQAEPAFIARSLERSGVIPFGGSTALTIEESFAQLGTVGVNRFPIASGQTFTNYVFGATLNWSAQPGTLNGCGLVVQDQGSSNTYLLAYIDSTGGVGLAQRQGDEYTESFFWDAPEIDSAPYRLVLVVREAGVLLYINGNRVGQIEVGAVAGGIGIAALNFEPTNTECQFDDIWLWQQP